MTLTTVLLIVSGVAALGLLCRWVLDECGRILLEHDRLTGAVSEQPETSERGEQ